MSHPENVFFFFVVSANHMTVLPMLQNFVDAGTPTKSDTSMCDAEDETLQLPARKKRLK